MCKCCFVFESMGLYVDFIFSKCDLESTPDHCATVLYILVGSHFASECFISKHESMTTFQHSPSCSYTSFLRCSQRATG